jgi:hypothetical protein
MYSKSKTRFKKCSHGLKKLNKCSQVYICEFLKSSKMPTLNAIVSLCKAHTFLIDCCNEASTESLFGMVRYRAYLIYENHRRSLRYM